MKLPNELKFLKSVRFWKLFIVAALEFLATQSIITPEIAHAISTILVGSVAVRTLDRMGEKIGTPQPDEITMGVEASAVKRPSVNSEEATPKKDLHRA